MKRAIALILSLIMALSLVACGTPAAPDNANTSDSEENNDPYTIAVVVKITGIAWYERMQVGIDKFNADTGNDPISPALPPPTLQNRWLLLRISSLRGLTLSW